MKARLRSRQPFACGVGNETYNGRKRDDFLRHRVITRTGSSTPPADGGTKWPLSASRMHHHRLLLAAALARLACLVVLLAPLLAPTPTCQREVSSSSGLRRPRSSSSTARAHFSRPPFSLPHLTARKADIRCTLSLLLHTHIFTRPHVPPAFPSSALCCLSADRPV